MEANEQDREARAVSGAAQNRRMKSIPLGIEDAARALFYDTATTRPRQGRALREFKDFSAWAMARVCLGVDSAEFKIHPALRVSGNYEVERVESLKEARSAAGARGGRTRKANGKQTESNGKANAKQTESNPEASESIEKGRERDSKVGGNPPTTPNTPTSRVCAGARAGGDGEPAPAETPEAEAKRLGFGQFEGGAAELRRLVPETIELAVVYFAADQKHVSPEDLLAWATHRQRQGWRAGQGSGVVITRYNVASDIAIWAKNQANFQRAPAAGGGGSARPTAAQQEGGAAGEDGRKAPKRKWKFEKSVMDEDRGRYVWGLPEEALAEFAAWFCGEEGNERAVGFYGRFIAANGASAFRRELDKFTGSIASGEEPENRGAAFTAALKAAERSEP